MCAKGVDELVYLLKMNVELTYISNYSILENVISSVGISGR